MKRLLLITTILIGLVGCNPECPCTVTKVEYSNSAKTDKIYAVMYEGNNTTNGFIYTDSAYQVGQIIIY